MDAAAGLEHSRQIDLRERIALVRGQTVLGCGALVILSHTDVIFIHAGELILRRSKTWAVLSQGLRVIEYHVAGTKIIIPAGKLCLYVSRSGGLAKTVESIVRRRWRRLGRGLYGYLRSRQGSQREQKESC